MLVPNTMAQGAVSRHQLRITPLELRRVLWVHHCEEGSLGWHVNGPYYFGGLGWRPATWLRFRAPWMPLVMSGATIREQAWAMVRFANTFGWPDLNGTCYAY